MARQPARGSDLTVLVLAAGKGSRLRSKTIKLLHPVAGTPMVRHVVTAAAGLKPTKTLGVVGYQADAVKAALADACDGFVLQKEQRGTGHAVLQGARALRAAGSDTVLILNGDVPTLRADTLKRFVGQHRRRKAVLSVLTAEIPDATGYGRIVRDAKGNFARIVEHRDASDSEREIREINSGIYCADRETLLKVLRRVRPTNAQGEYYITDAVQPLVEAGQRVIAWCHDDAEEVLGVNGREELAAATRTVYARKAAELQDAGVTLLDRSRTWIDPRAKVGRDTVIWPDVTIEGPCVIGEDCVIRSGSRLTDATLGDDVEIRDHCVVLESKVDRGAKVGPFAHLRPGAHLDVDTRVGNFVEIKKTHLGPGSKASHLSYLGDATIGSGCNIGAGTITCNYDGTHKHRTVLGDGVFIGSDSQLVAPVELGDRAFVAAGTTVTDHVDADALAIARADQRNVEGWSSRRRQRLAAAKAADDQLARRTGKRKSKAKAKPKATKRAAAKRTTKKTAKRR